MKISTKMKDQDQIGKLEITSPAGTYEEEEVKKQSLAYFGEDKLAADVWISKYALKNSRGDLFERTPEDMHHRLAGEIARIEEKYPNPLRKKEIFSLFDKFKYVVPQGGPMTGIGNSEQIASLSNCFVVGEEQHADSYGSILMRDQELVQLMKRRGGVGLDLSGIRPKGSPVKNSALTSTGVVPFMERYSNSTREVAQDGRRGALMLSIGIEHPDSPDFIAAKMEEGKVTGANVSVRVTDKFMSAVEQDSVYKLKFPLGAESPKFSKEIEAKRLWGKIIHNAWRSAEPGVLFWDTIIKESIPDCYTDLGFKTLSTNPCGEIPLCPYDSCRLIAINLYSYVQNPFTKEATFDFDLFKKHAQKTVRIMDDIIDLEIEKIDNILAKIKADPETDDIKATERKLWEKIRDKANRGRRTGVGITAEGDMLAALGLRYGSPEGNDFSEKVHKTLAIEAFRSSVCLAKERGKFSIYEAEREKDNPFILRIKDADPKLYEDMVKYGRRNIALLTIAPTGTTSLMTQTTSGIEPVFMAAYMRKRKVNPEDKGVNVSFVDKKGDCWEEYPVFHPKFKTWMQVHGIEEKEGNYTEKELEELVEKSPYFQATSADTDWEAKVDLQGRIQKWVDHSISVTINMPKEATEDLVDKLYMKAWRVGCKGLTIYRDGSRDGVLTSVAGQKDTEVPFPTERPEVLDADILRFKNGEDGWIAFVGLIDEKPYEIFTGIEDDAAYGLLLPSWVTKGKIMKVREPGKATRYDFLYRDKRGYEVRVPALSHLFNPEFWNYAKMTSSILRHGMSVPKAVALIESLHLGGESINSWNAGVARALKRYIPDGTHVKEQCENCQSTNLVFQEGCLSCPDCGSTKCG